MDLNGRDLVQITRGTDIQPKWSPDGRTIVFTRYRQNGRGDIYTMDANGHHLRELGSASGQLAVDWSPDGRKILFVRGAHVPGTLKKESSELWVMNADGTARARLAFNRPGWDVLGGSGS